MSRFERHNLGLEHNKINVDNNSVSTHWFQEASSCCAELDFVCETLRSGLKT